jgi:hypothetical protein
MEPTSGLEPLTCRLRKDPTLRMLLLNMSRLAAVLVHFGVFQRAIVQHFVQQTRRLSSSAVELRLPFAKCS